MTIAQKLKKIAYPMIMKLAGKKQQQGIFLNKKNIPANTSFFSLQATTITGEPFHFSSLKGKKVLIVNVASDCGFTGQYEELEQLYQRFQDKLIVLGFPANDFKEQEKGSNEEILQFCKLNYGVTFPLFQKHSVLKPAQHEVYEWLTHHEKNGWNDLQPAWNFSKYLVDENGNLKAFFVSAVSPLSDELISLL